MSRCTFLAMAIVLTAGCARPRPGASAPVAATPPVAAVADAGKASPGAIGPGNVTAQPSEQIAGNRPDPHCSDCQKGDTVQGPRYHGKPDMVLDEKTLAEVTATIDATCAILEDGVAILELHAKTPEKATAAIDAYRKKSASAIARTFEKAREIKARLKSAGYDQDIPAEVRPHFDARMTKIQERLEAMRDVYKKHPAVLEAFGALFPRGPQG